MDLAGMILVATRRPASGRTADPRFLPEDLPSDEEDFQTENDGRARLSPDDQTEDGDAIPFMREYNRFTKGIFG